MKRFRQLGAIALFASIICLMNNCKKDSPSNNSLSAKDLEINQFIWGGLNYWYLWVDSVPNLLSSTYQNSDAKLNSFLNGYTDHEKLFYDLLYKYEAVDKWSWIVDDYTQLENQLAGISKTFGFDFRLMTYGSAGTSVLGYVRYVLKNSPADLAGVKRGDIFIKVDDQPITKTNYQTLLFNRDSYKLSFATIVSNTITPNNKSVTLTSVEMQENPVFLDTVYNISSNKIGYLVYNGFYPDFDVALNSVFKKFKDAGIQNLILDLRYNGGGSIQSAIYLASMIYGPYTTKVFTKTKYNKQITGEILSDPRGGPSYFLEHFIDTIARQNASSSPTTINSLGLNKLYVITTGGTASASELVINGLKPYMNVVVIGTNSVGKYVGSTTVKDYTSSHVVNPDHKWAMQPIILKLSNANDESDYVNGFTPKVVVDERNYVANMLQLGDVNEPLLKAALNDLQGLSQQSAVVKSALVYREDLGDSKDYRPHAKEMYQNTGKINLLKKQ
jgi:C-terminal processing protease CtpA/Prc